MACISARGAEAPASTMQLRSRCLCSCTSSTSRRPAAAAALLGRPAAPVAAARRPHAHHWRRGGSAAGRLHADAAAHPLLAARATVADAGQQEDQATEEQERLNAFLVWLVANDVQGIGLDDSSVGLFENGPERGLLALKPIKAGEVVLRVPLRLALTDHAQDEESNRLLGSDAPWSVRLSTKLLRERAKGVRSAFYPYLQVLPAQVPAPLETFTWEDMTHIEWPPAQAALYEYNFLVSGSYQRAAGGGGAPDEAQQRAVRQAADAPQADGRPSSTAEAASGAAQHSTLSVSADGASLEADDAGWVVPDSLRVGSPAPSLQQITQVLGGADMERFQWAMSVVHSRTFANAAPGGGVGVRMLVPLVDMLNHAGDQTLSGRMDDPAVRATDNVRWDVVAPERSPLGCWEMCVKATRDVAAGQELLLCYREGPSDDFFLHYGFVPPLCNPHEDAVLFEDAEEALEWHHAQYAGQMAEAEAERVYTQAYATMLSEQRLAAAPPATASSSSAQAGEQQQQQQQQGPERSDSSPSTSGGEGAGLPRGWQKLKVYSSGRVDGALVSGFAQAMGGDVRAAELAVARRAQQLLAGMPTPVQFDLLALYQDACGGAEQGGGGGGEAAGRQREVLGGLLLHHARQQGEVERAVEREGREAAAWFGTAASSEDEEEEGNGQGGAVGGGGGGDVGGTLEGLVRELRRQVEARVAGGTPTLVEGLTRSQRLCLQYRVGKKLVLWGVVHRALCGQGAAQGPGEGSGLEGALGVRRRGAAVGVPRVAG